MPISNSKPRSFIRQKRFWLLLILLMILFGLYSCSATRLMMQTAPDKPRGYPASPPIEISVISEWESRQKGEIQSLFESEIYGPVPQNLALSESGRKTLTDHPFSDVAHIEAAQFTITNPANAAKRPFGLVVMAPTDMDGPVPLILSQNFCPNHNVVPVEGVPIPDPIGFDCSGDGVMSQVFTYFFGRYITTPPLKDILGRGYGFAAIYPTEFIPDSGGIGVSTLDAYFNNQPANTRTGALAAWAAQFNAVADHMKTEPRFSHIITYGHSRFGKTALIAAAFNANIDGVIAHQSGTGGASLSKQKPGETIADITQGYPHWFNRRLSDYSDKTSELPIDQHHLLALIAPRPVLLGNARRDVWSDPNGGFRAARAANPVYALYGSEGLTQKRLGDFDPKADIAFWIRPGTHGVVKEDWPAFLDFLDAHFK